MPVNFQFLKPDGTPESLLVIDQKLCDHFGEYCDPKNYHWSFHSLTWEGLAILRKSHASVITPDVFDKFAEIDPRAEAAPVFRKFLTEDYQFTAWYGRR